MKERTKTLLIQAGLLVCSFLPLFAALPFTQQDSSLVIKEVLMKTSMAYLWLSPIVHVVTVVLLVALVRYGSIDARLHFVESNPSHAARPNLAVWLGDPFYCQEQRA